MRSSRYGKALVAVAALIILDACAVPSNSSSSTGYFAKCYVPSSPGDHARDRASVFNSQVNPGALASAQASSYKAAAAHGNAAAQAYLGNAYYQAGDATQAAAWLRKAVDQGNTNAQIQYELAFLYDKGLGLNQDYAKAVELYQKSADQGYAPAQNMLGLLYLEGKVVQRDRSKAEALYCAAAHQGNESAASSLNQMTMPKTPAMAGYGMNRARPGNGQAYDPSTVDGTPGGMPLAEYFQQQQREQERQQHEQ